MDTKQLTTEVIRHNTEIATIGESVKSMHHRLDEIKAITSGIQTLAINVETLAVEVSNLAKSFEKSINRIETAQGAQDARIEALEKVPGDKWKKMIGYILAGITSAVIGVLAAKFL